MFTVYFTVGDDSYVVDNPFPNQQDKKLISPQLELESNTFGSLQFTVPVGHQHYSVLEGSNEDAEISVFRRPDHKRLFLGRLLDSKKDSMKNMQMIFEGELSYLQDSVQEPNEYKDITPKDYLSALLTIHNKKMPEKKQFKLGNVTVTDDDSTNHITGRIHRGSYSTSYSDTTWSCIESMVKSLGGHIEVRWEDGVRYLDYLKEYERRTGQPIDLGANMINYAEEWSLAELYTVIVPIGGSVTEQDSEGNSSTRTIDISSVNGGSVYLEASSTVLTKYGRREKAVTFSGIIDPWKLKQIGQLYLTNTQFDNLVLSLTAADLKILGFAEFTNDITGETIEIDDYLEFQTVVTASAAAYGMSARDFPITKVSLPLKDPGNAVYTMMTNTRAIKSISTAIKDHDDDLQDQINDLSDDVDEIKNEMTKYEQTSLATPSDWIFGRVEMMYEKKEVSLEFLKHPYYIYSEYEPLVEGDGTGPEGFTVLKSTEPIPSDWTSLDNKHMYPHNVWIDSIEGAESKKGTIKNADYEGHAELDISGGGEKPLEFNEYLYADIPIPQSDPYTAPNEILVVYAVVTIPEGSYAKIGRLNAIGGGLVIGADPDNGGELGYCTSEVDYTPFTFSRPGGSDGPISVYPNNTAKPLVIAHGKNIANGKKYYTTGNVPNLWFGLNAGYSVDSMVMVLRGTQAPLITGNFRLNMPFYNPSETYISDGRDRKLYVHRVVVCRSLTGQITADEVYDNVQWLAEQYCK